MVIGIDFTKHIMGENSKIIEEIFKYSWDKPFIRDLQAKEDIRYKDIYLSALNMKIYLDEIGVNEKVAISAENSPKLVSVIFSLMLSNRDIFFLSSAWNEDTITRVLKDYGISTLITDRKNLNKCEWFGIKVIDIHRLPFDMLSTHKNYKHKFNGRNGILCFFTSGSAGKPKCVVHNFETFKNNASYFFQFMTIEEPMKLYPLQSITYMAGFYHNPILALLSGGYLVLRGNFRPNHIFDFWEIVNKYKVNVLWLTPSIARLLTEIYRKEISVNNKLIFSCTAPLTVNTKRKFFERFNIPLYNSYGLSETLFVSVENESFYKEEEGAVGHPIQKVSIVNDEIVIVDDSCYLGYLSKDGTIHKPFPFSSKDMGYLKNSILYIKGRKDFLIIRGGIKIFPEEIESFILSKIDYISECGVIGVKDDFKVEKIVCFLALKEAKDKSYILEDINSILPPQWKIDEVVIVDKLPKTPSMKIDRIRLKRRYFE